MSLEGQARAGVRWVAVAQAVTTLLGIVQLAVLGRLLSPAEFGLVAMAMVVVGFAQLFADLGISAGIIHRQDATREQLSTLYWLNIALGCLMSGLLFASARLIAAFNETPAMQAVLCGLAPLFLLNAVGVQFRVLQQKALLFRRLAMVDVTAAAASLATGVSAALAGWGALALVAGTLSSAVVAAMINLHWGVRNQKPVVMLSIKGVSSYIRFGGFRTGENVINYFQSQADIFIVGRLLGIEALGLYSMARNLCMRPSSVFNPVFSEVAFPVMAKLQEDKQALRQGYLKGLRVLSTLNASAHLLIVVAAEPLVLLLLGDAWIPAVPLVRILAVCWLLRSMGSPVGVLLLATGRVERGFYWNCVVLMFVPLLVYMGSASMGTVGAASGMLLVQLLMFFPLWRFLVFPACGAGALEYGRATLVPVGLTAFVALAAGFVASWMETPLTSLVMLAAIALPLHAMVLNRLDRETWLELLGVLRG